MTLLSLKCTLYAYLLYMNLLDLLDVRACLLFVYVCVCVCLRSRSVVVVTPDQYGGIHKSQSMRAYVQFDAQHVGELVRPRIAKGVSEN